MFRATEFDFDIRASPTCRWTKGAGKAQAQNRFARMAPQFERGALQLLGGEGVHSDGRRTGRE